jgi:hypothetical protein
LVKKKKKIKIVRESGVNYTFIDTGLSDIKRESEVVDKTDSSQSMEKDIIKSRSIDSKKLKIRYKDRVTGGHNQQGHSSVYE